MDSKKNKIQPNEPLETHFTSERLKVKRKKKNSTQKKEAERELISLYFHKTK
jgi:hypothetical protein